MSGLELSGVSKSFKDFDAVRDVSISVKDGDFAVFVGPSGCGKSTLMRLIAGLDPVTSGRVFIQGQDVTRRPAGKRSVAMVFQSYALYPHMSVYDNIAFPLKMSRKSRSEIRAAVTRAAETVQLGSRLRDKPSMLSGGQRQRVAIARAIVRQPSVFLMDEPLSNLDAALRTQMRTELTDLHQRLGATMIYVTHDQLEAMTMADLIVVLNGGRVEQIGRPIDLYHNPANLFVAGFIGSPPMNFVPVRARGGDGGRLVVEGAEIGQLSLPFGAGRIDRGAGMTIGFRPEGVRSEPPGDQDTLTLTVRPVTIERLGLHTIVHARLGDRMVTCLFGGDPEIARGDALTVHVPHDQLRLFGTDGTACATGPGTGTAR